MNRILILVCIFSLTLSAVAFAAQPNKKKKFQHVRPDIETGVGILQPDLMPVQRDRDARHLSPAIVNDEKLSLINGRWTEGIDVSHYQGTIDWVRVANEANISYAYIKATEGANNQDAYYERNIHMAHDAGLSVSAYHFYRSNCTPEENFANMRSVVQAKDLDLIPMIDVESGGNARNFVENLRIFLDLVTNYYGKRPIIYTYQNFYNAHLVGQFPGYSWMIAKYKDGEPILNEPLDYGFWQYSCKGSIPGISGHCDRSCIMRGHSLKELKY